MTASKKQQQQQQQPLSIRPSSKRYTEIVSEDEAGVLQARFILSPEDARADTKAGAKGPEQLRVDIETPERSVRSITQAVVDVFLPAGYPHSVTEDYLEYQVYDSLQAFASSIAGLLSSRAVLEGVGVGDASASTTSAIILNIISTSLGRVTTILFAHRLGTALEPECKMYRLLADIFNDIAMILELLSPAFPRPVTVGILAVAGALKALCGVAAGSSKASLSAHFAKWGNLGELNAKDSSQETVIGLVGMFAGGFVVSAVQGRTATWITLLVLLAAHLWLNYCAVRAVALRTLNRQRFGILLEAWAAQGRVLSPVEVRARERIFEGDGIVRDSRGAAVGRVRIGVTMQEFLEVRASTSSSGRVLHLESSTDLSEQARDQPYLIQTNHSKRQCWITLRKGCTTKDQLRAWACAWVMLSSKWTDSSAPSQFSNASEQVEQWLPELTSGLERSGWDISTGALETQRGSRFSLRD